MLKPFCRPCRKTLAADARFCNQCGDLIQRGSQEPTLLPEEEKREFAAPTPSIDGERKLVSVVFADLTGFTSMSEKLDPEQVTDIMNACFKRLGSVVTELEGYIDKFMGDCMMILFGAPVAHENDPELSIRCSLKLLEELAAFNTEMNSDLGLSIGVNSGVVIAGGVGSEGRQEYTVMGDAVNTAQRLQSAAGRNQIFVSKSIFEACRSYFNFEELKPLQVKGKQDALAVYSVKSVLDQCELSESRKLSTHRMVGRDKELEAVETLLGKVLQSDGQLLFVSGEAGVGKSRFKREVRSLVESQKIRWIEGKCERLTRARAYAPFIQILHAALPDLEAGGLDESIEAAGLGHLDSISRALLGTLLGLSSCQEEIAHLDSAQRKRALFIAFKSFISELAKAQPLAIYVEDLHWIDPVSHELIGQLVDSIPKIQCFFYAAFRKDFQHNWHQKTNFTQINLQALSPEQCSELAKGLLEMETLPQDLENLIQEKADGNPLYVEEILKTLVDSGQIVKNSQGTWKLDVNRSDFDIPHTLQGLIASRIDRLDEQQKQALQVASVIGRQFKDSLLSKSMGSPPEIQNVLKQLQHRELIFEFETDLESTTYIFKHALTQEVAYNGILEKKRKVFHKQVAQCLEAVVEKKPQEETNLLEELAYHFSKTDFHRKAVSYLYKSGQNLSSNYNNAGAIRAYETALEVLENKLSEHAGEDFRKISLALADSLTLSGEYASSSELLKKLIDSPEAKENRSFRSQCSRRLGDIEKTQGHSPEAIKTLESALEDARSSQDRASEARAFKALGSVYTFRNEPKRALSYFELGLEDAKKLEDWALTAQFLNDIAIVHINTQALDLAEKTLREAIQIVSTEKSQSSLLVSLTLNLGVVFYYRKDYPVALEKFEQAARIAEKIGDIKNVLISTHNLGEIHKEYENYSEAIQCFDQAYELAEAMGNQVEMVNNQAVLGYLRAKLGNEEAGVRLVEQSIVRAQEMELWPHYCDALHYLGCLYMDSEDYLRAEQAFNQALREATKLKNSHQVQKLETAIEDLKGKHKLSEKK